MYWREAIVNWNPIDPKQLRGRAPDRRNKNREERYSENKG